LPFAAKLAALDLANHQRMIVRDGAAFHFAKFDQSGLQWLAISEVFAVLVKVVIPLIARALMVVPPAAPGLHVAAVQLFAVGFVPGLRGVSRDESVIEHHGARWVFLVHDAEPA